MPTGSDASKLIIAEGLLYHDWTNALGCAIQGSEYEGDTKGRMLIDAKADVNVIVARVKGKEFTAMALAEGGATANQPGEGKHYPEVIDALERSGARRESYVESGRERQRLTNDKWGSLSNGFNQPSID